MAKFTVLKYNQLFMSRLGFFHLKFSTEEFQKSAVAYLILVHLILLTISSGMFAINSSDVTKKFDAVMLIVAGAQSAGCYLSVAFNMKKVNDLHLELQGIVEKDGENEMDIYWNTEQKCRKYTKLIFSYIFCHQSTFGAALFYSLYLINAGNFDTSTYFLPFAMVPPIDTTTLAGWYWFWFIQFSISLSYISCMVAVSSYFVCCCLYIEAICDNFAGIIVSIRKMVEQSQIEKKKRNNLENKIKIKYQIHDAVELHVNIFRIFCMVSDINNGTIFSLLPQNCILVAAALYSTEHSAADMAPAFILYSILCVASSLMWPYIFASFATRVTERILSIGDVAYDSEWLDYPPELKKYIVLIIARSQQEVYFTGFNLVGCTLTAFGKIIKSSCSFYLLFRSFTQL